MFLFLNQALASFVRGKCGGMHFAPSLSWPASNDTSVTRVTGRQRASSGIFCSAVPHPRLLSLSRWTPVLATACYSVSDLLSAGQWLVNTTSCPSPCLIVVSLLVPQLALVTFHNKREPRVDGLHRLFRRLCGHRLPALGAGRPPPSSAAKMSP